MTCWSLKAQQHWLGLDCSPLPCSPPRIPRSQRLQEPPKQTGHQAFCPPCSQWPLVASEKGLVTGGAEAQQGGNRGKAGSVLALDSFQVDAFRGHCMEAGPRMRPPLHVTLSLQLKVTAAPGPLLSLCLGASPTEDPAGPSPGPMPKLRSTKGSARRESKEESCPQSAGGPLPETRPSTWNLRGWKPGPLPGQTSRVGDQAGDGHQNKEAHSPGVPVPPTLCPQPSWWESQR